MDDRVRHLYTSFRRLRQTKAFKQHVTGGMAILEVTRNVATGLWHPHFHIVAQGTYWKASELSDAWKAASGDSFIVDIRAVDDYAVVAHYLLSYVSKGCGPEIWRDQAALSEYIGALSNTKMCVTFGTWRKLKLLARPTDDASWEPLCSAHKLIADAIAGDDQAATLARRLWGNRWLTFIDSGRPAADTS